MFFENRPATQAAEDAFCFWNDVDGQRMTPEVPPFIGHPDNYRFKDFCHFNLDRCHLFHTIRRYGEACGGAKLFSAVSRAYQHWLFERWMPQVTSDLASAIRMLEYPGAELAARRFLDRLSESMMLVRMTKGELHQMNKTLVKALSNGELKEIEGQTSWSQSTMETTWLMHDVGNILTGFAMNVSMASGCRDPEKAATLLKLIQGYDFSSIASTVQFVAGIQKSRAREFGVELELGAIPAVALPNDGRIAFFRILSELMINAIKYRDREKAFQRVAVRADRIGPRLFIHVMDNGMGIVNFRQFTQNCRGIGGWREHPQLAQGDGYGVCSMAELAKQQKWGFFIASGARVGTDAGVYMDIAGREVAQKDSTSRLLRSINGSVPDDVFSSSFYSSTGPYSTLNVGALNCFHVIPNLYPMRVAG
jgi:hypothetical protein